MVFLAGQSLPRQIAAIGMDALCAVVNRNELLPPFSMRRLIGEQGWQLRSADFQRQGQHFVEKLSQDVGLTQDTRLLDLGSGCGRIAIPLTRILGPSGLYVGLEPNRAMVRWCERRIASAYQNFEFLNCDLYSELYNPNGTIRPETLSFPFANSLFDIVVATSLFTHLTPNATCNYFRECARVLKRRGRMFATFFLLDNGTQSPTGLDFRHQLGEMAKVTDPALPERAIAYAVDWVLGVAASHGIQLVPPVRWGGWTGRKPEYSFQDVLILEKQSQ
jgi:ubiquinone/menaquinone biosynthesis C-methylase UbiE